MSIEGIHSSQIVQKLRSIEENSNAKSATSGDGVASDEVSISSDARLAQTLNRAEEAISEAPEVREDRVEQAKQRLDQGFYDSDEVLKSIADRLTQTLFGG